MTFLQGSARRCQLEITDRRFCPGNRSSTESRVQALSQEIVLISSCKLSTLSPREDVRGPRPSAHLANVQQPFIEDVARSQGPFLPQCSGSPLFRLPSSLFLFPI